MRSSVLRSRIKTLIRASSLGAAGVLVAGCSSGFERFRTLHEKAGQRFSQLGIANIVHKLEDGSKGSFELGIYDRIVANFAFLDQPREFIDNIASNGVMIAPVGPPDGIQMMKKYTKIGSRLQVENLFEVRVQSALHGISKAI